MTGAQGEEMVSRVFSELPRNADLRNLPTHSQNTGAFRERSFVN